MPLQRQVVSVDSKPDDLPRDDGGNGRMVPELLAGMHVGDVHLDRGRLQVCQRITDGVTVVSKRSGVDDDPGR